MIRFLNRLSQIRRRYSQRPFWFRTEFQKGHSFLESFQKIIICESAGIFVAQQRHKNPGFFFFKKGAGCQYPISGRSPVLGRTAFFIFLEQCPVPQKGRWRKWRLKLKKPNKANSKLSRTRPEYRSHTGPPAQTEKPICTASPLCEGCPFPGHGFLCRGEDGECMRTRLMKLSKKEEPI